MATALSPVAAEAREPSFAIDIAAGPLPAAVADLSRQAGVSIGSDTRLPASNAGPIRGRMSVETALARLLAGTGLIARKVGQRAWRIEKAAPAQPGRPKNPGALAPATPPPPITVTANKQKIALSRLPLAVAVVTMPDQAADPAQDTHDLAARVEGLALSGPGPGRNRMFLRGIADSAFSGESQSTVAVLLDDTRLTYSAPDPDIRLVDVDRVEVIKGPSGSLYGSGSLGGIYHVVTRRPQLDETRLVASAGTELAGLDEIGHSVSLIANVPVARDKVALRLVGYSVREPGWIDTGTRQDSNDTQVTGLRAMAGIKVSDDWRLDLTGFGQWLTSRDSTYVYAEDARSRPEQLAEPHDNDLRHVAVRLGRDGGNVRIVASTGATWHEVGDRIDATIGAKSFGVPDPQVLEDDRTFRVWDNELRISNDGGKTRWLIGLSHVSARQDLLTVLQGMSDERTLHDDRRTSNDLAVFGSLTLPLGGGFSADASGRLSRERIAETHKTEQGEAKVSRSRVLYTPGFGVSWQPDTRQIAWLRYSSASRRGGIEITESAAPMRLEGDELQMVEAGWRAFAGGGSHFELGAWYGRWSHVQSDELQANGLIETRNAGDARTMGIELSFALRLAEHWHMEGGGNFTMAKLVKNELGYELKDRHLPIVPEYTLRGSIRHDFAIGAADAELSLVLRYVGPSRLSFDEALDRPMGKLVESSLGARVSMGRLDLDLSVNNLLGGEEDTFAFGNSLRFATMRQYTPQQPRSVSFRLTRDF